MKTLEWTYEDKSDWRRGPWDNEPDKRQWQDVATGYPCLIVRGGSGALCGYVGVPKGHPLHGVEHEDLPNLDGPYGVNYSAPGYPDGEGGVCHVPDPGEPDDVWWLGFDCAHGTDETPAIDTTGWATVYPRAYRDVAFVTKGVTELAADLFSRA